jgi:cell division protein FtsQ
MKGDRANLIDAEGRVLSGIKPGTPVDLPRVAGEGAAQDAKAFLDLDMRFPSIWKRFEIAERVGDRRWTLHLKNRITIHFAADREAVALGALASAEDLGALLSGRDLIIELRTPGRIAVRRDKHIASQS